MMLEELSNININRRIAKILNIQEQFLQRPYGKPQGTLAQSCLDNSFKMRFDEEIICVKVQLLSLLEKEVHKLNIIEIDVLGKKFTHFLKDFNSILQEGLLNFMTALYDGETNSNTPQLHRIIEEIFDIITRLIRMFFANKEYLRMMEFHKNKNANEVVIISNELSIQDIEDLYSAAETKELINEYLKKQQENIGQTLQICRICSDKIPLKCLLRHVELCQLRESVKSKIKQTEKHLQKVLLRIKKQCFELENKDQSTRQQLELLCVMRTVIKSNKKWLAPGRASIFTLSKSNDIAIQLKQSIYSYGIQFGESPLLTQFLALITLKDTFKKRLDVIARKQRSSQESLTSLRTNSRGKSTKTITKKPQRRNMGPRKSSFHQQMLSSQNPFNEQISRATHKQYSQDKQNFPLQWQNRFPIVREQRGRHPTIQYRRQSSVVPVKYKRRASSETEINISQQQNNEANGISLKNLGFEFLQFLGKGAFGQVFLARRINTEDLYAIKMLIVDPNWNEKQIQSIRNQHQTFKRIASDHLVKAPFAFSQKMGHFFVMEYMPGGDLSKLLTQEVYLQEQAAKFYLAEIVLAIEHLHQFGIIHRDLKPQNLVIDKNGHLKLTDFGLSDHKITQKIQKVKRESQRMADLIKVQKDQRKRRTARVQQKSEIKLIGTPDYIAPQIISQTSFNNETIDWWSLGVMAYEILIGTRPFCGKTVEEVINNIISFTIEWPEIGEDQGGISSQAQDLILKLMERNFTARLGCSGSSQIKTHPFFKGIDWVNIKNQKPPIEVRNPSEFQTQAMKQNKLIRDDVENLIRGKRQMPVSSENKLPEDQKRKPKLRLSNFVRVDLLTHQTFQSAEKALKGKEKTLKRLKTLVEIIDEEERRKSTHSIDSFPL